MPQIFSWYLSLPIAWPASYLLVFGSKQYVSVVQPEGAKNLVTVMNIDTSFFERPGKLCDRKRRYLAGGNLSSLLPVVKECIGTHWAWVVHPSKLKCQYTLHLIVILKQWISYNW